jgi:hypothetical protein
LPDAIHSRPQVMGCSPSPAPASSPCFRPSASSSPVKKGNKEGELKSRTCQLVVLEMPITERRMPRGRAGPRGGGREWLETGSIICTHVNNTHPSHSRVVVVAPAVARRLDSQATAVSISPRKVAKDPYFSPMNGLPWSSRQAESTSCKVSILVSHSSLPLHAQTRRSQSWT